ncbi:FAD-binding protein [Aquirufa echingensis]|jgi:xylitol oxidase|uniref:FAD-binding protein n=1 Tax=Aquirufa echingensis TaxID=3096516 RepID=A0ABW6CY96_9BACT
MKRIEFIKSSALLAFSGSLLNFQKADTGLTNWAGNLRYHAKQVVYPTTVDELRKAVLEIKQGKALGSKHSFNTVADTTETLISTSKLNKVISLDTVKGLVWAEGGIKYGDLGLWIDQRGYAIHNLASLPHISVAGACATATHGSGGTTGNLSTAVEAIEIMKADGTLMMFDKSNPKFYGAVVNIGALGIVTKVALKVYPRFEVTQEVYENLPMSALKGNIDTIFGLGYSVSMFTHWLDQNINQLWVKKKVEGTFKPGPKTILGATAATTNLHPIKLNSPINCTDQMGVPGPWYERLPHFKMGFTPSNGAELQSEFFVPRKHAYEALLALEKLHPEVSPILFVTEIRSIAADELWLSPAYKQDVIAFHFTWKPETEKVMAVLPKVEAALKPFNYMPHWGKIFTIAPADLQSRYPKFKDFVALAKEMDPAGKWKNGFLERNIYS